MKKAPFSAIDANFSNGPRFYNTDGPAGNWVKFDKDISQDTCLRNLKKIRYKFYLCSGVWIITLICLCIFDYIFRFITVFISQKIDFLNFERSVPVSIFFYSKICLFTHAIIMKDFMIKY